MGKKRNRLSVPDLPFYDKSGMSMSGVAQKLMQKGVEATEAQFELFRLFAEKSADSEELFDDTQLLGMCSLAVCHAIMEECGRQVFVVGPRMQDLLFRTSLEGVAGEMLRLPYPAFYVALPNAKMTVPNARGEPYPLVGAYVRDGGLVHKGDQVKGIVTFPIGHNPEVKSLKGYGLSTWTTDCYDNGDHFEELAEKHEMGELSLYTSRIIFNLSLYLRSDGARVDRENRRLGTSFPRRRRKGEVPRPQGPTHYTFVGRDVEMDKGREKRAEAGHVSAHWVRGHWRLQPHGPGRSQRKLIWIQPFYKPGVGESPSPRTYTFQEVLDER